MCFLAQMSLCRLLAPCVVLAIPGWLLLLLIPSVEREVFRLSHTHLVGDALAVANAVITARHFVFCMGDYLWCVKDLIIDDLVSVYGWDAGVGVGSIPSMGVSEAPVYFSHAQYSSVAYDPRAGRPMDALCLTNRSDLPLGILPDRDPILMLNCDTGSQEHIARRQLLARAFPALKKEANADGAAFFGVPAHVLASEAAILGGSLVPVKYYYLRRLERAVADVVGLNLFRDLFDVDITPRLSALASWEAALAKVFVGAPLRASEGPRLRELRLSVEEVVATGNGARRVLEAARLLGLPAEARLEETVWLVMFAGYGGTRNLAFGALKHMLKDAASRSRLFRKDPAAYMLEAARLLPPVAGMNLFQFRKARVLQSFPFNRSELKSRPGDVGIIHTSGANRDPQVFGRPDDFLPGRVNAEKLLSWNNEWGHIRSCGTVAGCPMAPRGCPGAFLSLRLATKTVEFFVAGIEEAGLGFEKEL